MLNDTGPLPIQAGERQNGAVPPDPLSRNEISRVFRGGLVAFAVYGVGYALTYLSQLVLARLAGPIEYGEYAYASAWVVLLTYIATLGFDVGLLRFVPAYRATKDWPLLLGLIRFAQSRTAIMSMSVAAAGAAIVMLYEPSREAGYTFLVGMAMVPILALLRVRCAIVRAIGAVMAALAPDRIIREGVLIALVGGGWITLNYAPTAPIIMLAALASSVTALLLTQLSLSRTPPVPLAGYTPEYDKRAWRSAALPLLVLGASEVLLNRTGVILLGWMTCPKEAGVYSLAFNVALIVTLPRVAINTLFAPTLSGLHSVGCQQEMRQLVAWSSAWTFAGGAVVALALFAGADVIMLWFGPQFEHGVLQLRILLCAQLFAAGAGSQLYIMTMTGHERTAAAILVSITMLNLLISFVLVKLLGVVGASVGTASALLLWNGAMAWFIRRRLQLKPAFQDLCASVFSPGITNEKR